MTEDANKILRKIADGGSVDGGTFTAGTTGGTVLQGIYEATPTSVADGKAGAVGMTANRALKVSQDTLIAGEDLTADRLKVELKGNPFQLTASATIGIAKSTSGVLLGFNVGQVSAPTLTIYDNASGASGTILALIEPGARGSYVLNESFNVGCTAHLTAGNAPAIVLSVR